MAQRWQQHCVASIKGTGSQVCTCAVWLPPPENPCLFHPGPGLLDGATHVQGRSLFISQFSLETPHGHILGSFFANLGIPQSRQTDRWGVHRGFAARICVHAVCIGPNNTRLCKG